MPHDNPFDRARKLREKAIDDLKPPIKPEQVTEEPTKTTAPSTAKAPK